MTIYVTNPRMGQPMALDTAHMIYGRYDRQSGQIRSPIPVTKWKIMPDKWIQVTVVFINPLGRNETRARRMHNWKEI